MEYTNFITIKNNEENSSTSYTFGYLWYKESESSNERHLYLGKSGKGSCIHIVYIVDEMVAFKTNIGYFKECDINKSLKRGAGGSLVFILLSFFIKSLIIIGYSVNTIASCEIIFCILG